MSSSTSRGQPFGEQRVSTEGAVHFYNPDSHSVYRQQSNTAARRVDYQLVTEDGDVGVPTRYLPGAQENLRPHGLFQKLERRVDADGELRSFPEIHRKYWTSRTSQMGGQPVGFRWEEARSRSIAWRLRMSSFERRLLKPLGWAVATQFEIEDLSSRRRTVYYERASGKLGGNLPQSLERLARHDVAYSPSADQQGFRTWDPKRMAFHDGSLECPPDVVVDMSDARAVALVEQERRMRGLASANSELHSNLQGFMSFDDVPPLPSQTLPNSHDHPQLTSAPEEKETGQVIRRYKDAYGEFSIGGPPSKKVRKTVPVLDRAAHQLDPQGRWMPVFDVGPEPFNLPRENDGYYALLAPGEHHSVPLYQEDRCPRFVPYNGSFVCGKCFRADSDVHGPRLRGEETRVSLDAVHLLTRNKALAEHERDMARLALAAAEVELTKLRREKAVTIATTLNAAAPFVAEAPVGPVADNPQPGLADGADDAKAKKRAQEAKRAADARAKVEDGFVLTRSGIEEHGTELLAAFLKAMALAVRGTKSDMKARLNAAFDRLGVLSWKSGDGNLAA